MTNHDSILLTTIYYYALCRSCIFVHLCININLIFSERSVNQKNSSFNTPTQIIQFVYYIIRTRYLCNIDTHFHKPLHITNKHDLLFILDSTTTTDSIFYHLQAIMMIIYISTNHIVTNDLMLRPAICLRFIQLTNSISISILLHYYLSWRKRMSSITLACIFVNVF